MALKPAGGKYEGVWLNELKNGGTINAYIIMALQERMQRDGLL